MIILPRADIQNNPGYYGVNKSVAETGGSAGWHVAMQWAPGSSLLRSSPMRSQHTFPRMTFCVITTAFGKYQAKGSLPWKLGVHQYSLKPRPFKRIHSMKAKYLWTPVIYSGREFFGPDMVSCPPRLLQRTSLASVF